VQEDKVFKATIIFKFLDGSLQFLSGISLFFIKPQTIEKLIISLSQRELLEDPKDFFANAAIHLSQSISLNSKRFVTLYLIFHGIINITLAIGLWQRKHWAYLTAMIFLNALMAYQIYRINHTHSIALFFLTLLDAAVIWIIYRDYRLHFKRSLL